MLRRSRVFGAFCLALLAAPSRSPASGSAPPPRDSSRAPLALGAQDFVWIPSSIILAVPAQIRYRDMAPADTNDLDADRDLWAIDRWAAGTYSPAAALASDALIFPLLVLPMAATAWDSHKGNQSWRAAFEDAVVYGEACALSSSLDLLARSARVHPRPLVYGKDVPADERLSGEASGSFYSGHANGAFLSAVYFSYTYSLRHPESDLRGWLWAGSLGTAAAVSGLRVAAGKHYLSDVVIGAAAGSFFGWIFPYMHRSEASGLRLGMAIGGSTAYPVLAWRF